MKTALVSRYGLVAAGLLTAMTVSVCAVAAVVVPDLANHASTQMQSDVDGDTLGRAAAFIGDVNDDGWPDLLIGASSDRGSTLGARAYVIFGTAGRLPANLDVSMLDGSNGFVLSMAQTTSRLGFSVAGLGDINNDGIDDFAVGAPNANTGTGAALRHFVGKVFVVFGRTGGSAFPATLDLDTLDGSDGFAMSGIFDDDHLGYAMASSGDFNGDGIPDLLVGSYSNSGANNAWIVLGADTAFPAALDLTSLASGGQGFRLLAGANTGFTRSLTAIGDLDDDGMDDVVIGAPAATMGPVGNAGRVYIVHGRAISAASGSNVLSLDPPASDGVQRLGDTQGYFAGAALTGLGDINGDGIPDFMIGAPGHAGYVGAAWMVLGSKTLASGSLQTMSVNGGAIKFEDSNGGYNTNVGAAVAGGADFDGDGISDIVIGVPGGHLRSGETRNGSVYIIPGRDAANPWPMSVDLASLNHGLRLDGVTDVGPSSIGDMRGDLSLALRTDANDAAKTELLIGSPLAHATTSDQTHGPWQGRAWLVPGQSVGDVIFRNGFDGI